MTSLTELAADKSLQSAVDKPYFQDLQLLVSCLSCLPNITMLSVKRRETLIDAQPPEYFFESLRIWLSKNYGFIERLTLTVKQVSLLAFQLLPTCKLFASSAINLPQRLI